jgi:hypothetical protein
MDNNILKYLNIRNSNPTFNYDAHHTYKFSDFVLGPVRALVSWSLTGKQKPEPGGSIQGSRARPSAAGMDRGVVPAGGEGGRGSHDVDGRDGRAGAADSDDLEAGTGGKANAGNSDTCAGPGAQHARGDNDQAAGQAQAAGRGEESPSALAAAPAAGRGEEASSAGACTAGTISVPAQSCLPEALRNKDESMMVLEREIDHLVC